METRFVVLDSCPQSHCLLPFSLPATAYITKLVKEEHIICSGALSRIALACFLWNVQYGMYTGQLAVRMLGMEMCSFSRSVFALSIQQQSSDYIM